MTNLLPVAGKRLLGTSGMEISPLAWGMWRFKGNDLGEARQLVHAALDSGFSLLDTADVYGLDSGEPFGAAEALLGRVLESDPTLRERFVLSTKGGIIPGTPYNSSAPYLTSACEASLRRLKTEVIDLYQIHRPDMLAHPHEVAEALTTLRDSGKIRHAGVSNYSVSQTAALQSVLPYPLVSHQPEFSALSIDPLVNGILDQAIEKNMSVLAWSPLAGGRLANHGTDKRSRALIGALDKIAIRDNKPRTAVALAWVLAHPSRPVAIIGTQNVTRMSEAVRALDVRLTREDWYSILSASRQAKLP
jgi:predicted oxidoreductase